jgi:3-keto-5-aminohexanoate cleavage enzyme
MASLSTGSVNFPTIVYENSPALVADLAAKMQECGVRPEIEVFDLPISLAHDGLSMRG